MSQSSGMEVKDASQYWDERGPTEKLRNTVQFYSNVLGCIAGVPYIVFGVIFFISDVNVCGTFSPLWIFSLFAFLYLGCFVPVVVLILSNIFNCTSTATMLKRFLVAFIISVLPVIAYGYVIIYGYTCDEMKTKGLWIFALVTYWWTVTIALIGLIALLSLPWWDPELKYVRYYQTDSQDEREYEDDNFIDNEYGGHHSTSGGDANERVPIYSTTEGGRDKQGGGGNEKNNKKKKDNKL